MLTKFTSGFYFFILMLSTTVSANAFASVSDKVNETFGTINSHIASVFFFDILFFTDLVTLPFAVAWLVMGAVYFTFKMEFINIRLFKRAINIVRGKYDDPDSVGEVSHFAALTTALSATVGLGNIAGVAIAISIGGPGATFWMIMAGFLGMSSKFTECTLAQMYRKVQSDGQIMGGPQVYLKEGLKDMGFGKLGKFLAIFFTVLCIGGSFGGGSSFQVNQSLSAVQEIIPFFGKYPAAYGIIMVIAVGIVIIGGIKRIADVAEKVVPAMCGIYVLACLYILVTSYAQIPAAISLIFKSAFSFEAGFGGFLGVIVTGFKRAAFSNEAGLGSAAIAHSAAKTKYAAEEGIVALLEPFIDTIVVCTMTALVIVITNAANNPEWASLVENSQGAALTSAAMGSVISWFPYLLSIAVILFAYSTIISWSYYGERCFVHLFSEKYSMVYKVLLLIVIFLGSITTSTNILEFGDLMILGMGIPNILGLLFLSGKVKAHLKDYLKKVPN